MPGSLIAVVNADSEQLLDQALALVAEPPRRSLFRHRPTAVVAGARGYFQELSVSDNLALGSPTSWHAGSAHLRELCERFDIFPRVAAGPPGRALRGIICLVRAVHLSPESLVVDDVCGEMRDEDWQEFVDIGNSRANEGKTTIYTMSTMRYDRLSVADELLIYRGDTLVFRGHPDRTGPARSRLLMMAQPDGVAGEVRQMLRARLSDASSDHELASIIAGVLRAVFGTRGHCVCLDRGGDRPLVRVTAADDEVNARLRGAVALAPGGGEEIAGVELFTLTVDGEDRRDLGSIGLADDVDSDPIALDPVSLADAVGAAVDNFDQRQRALQISKDLSRAEAVRTLVGGIAHDFNNALQAIYGSSDLIAHYNEDQRLDRIVDTLRLVTQDAQVFVSKLLAFSRVADLRVERVDMHAVLRDAVDMAERGATRSIAVELSLEAERSIVFGDAAELRNVFVNLLLNSSRAVPPEGGVIKVDSRVTDDEDQTLIVTVADNGSGIPSEIADRIFLPFITTRDRSLGTGLGLAVARAIMHEHRGDVSLVESSSAGTTMNVSMPLAPDLLMPDEGLRPARARSARQPGRALTVLVCDDDDSVLDVVGEMLRVVGHVPILAGSGKKALDVFGERSGEIDVCIVDQLMPDMTGDEVIGHIRAAQPDMPCISLSGFRPDDLSRRPSMPGRDPDLWLTKPIGMAELGEALLSVVPDRRSIDRGPMSGSAVSGEVQGDDQD